MYKNMIFTKPPICNAEIKEKFDLDDVITYDRTSVYENDDMMFSIDENVVRIMIYDENDKNLVRKIKKYFYGDKK